MDNISILDKKNCTGCRMCEQICPVKAIIMVENVEGFLEPYIDENKCTKCGICSNFCPQLNDVKIQRVQEIKAYAAKNKNIKEQEQSSSGGMFSALANYVLDNNGIVYGCAFNEKIEAEHIAINQKNEIYKLRGSKYVQSNTKNTFRDVKDKLESNKLVLYSGTPCQIAALKAFLRKEYENLITIDLVCHGVPSPKMFAKYIKWLEENNNAKITKYEFRNKEKNGWGLTAKVTFENGKSKYIKAELDPYYSTFLDARTYREVCYNCKYANINRISDITLADYWGIENEHPNFYDEKGVSAILINTEKGKKFLEKIDKDLFLEISEIKKIIKRNENLKASSKRKDIRNTVYKNYENVSFDDYIKTNLKFKRKRKDIIKNMIPYSFKKKIKKILRRKK